MKKAIIIPILCFAVSVSAQEVRPSVGQDDSVGVILAGAE